MKQVTIKAKATIVVIDIPDHHVANITHIAPGLDTLTIQDVRTGDYVFGINGIFKAAGHPSKLTEEDWKGIVDFFTTDEDFGKEDVFRDYSGKNFFDTATESGLSLLRANGVVMYYDFDDCANPFCEDGRIDMGYNESMTCSLCEEAQEQVWLNPSLFLLV